MESETLVPIATATEDLVIVERRTSGGKMASETLVPIAISKRPVAVANSVVRADDCALLVLSETDLCRVTCNDTMLLLLSKGMGRPRNTMGGEHWWVRCWER